jgi:hypothetical protein
VTMQSLQASVCRIEQSSQLIVIGSMPS